MPIKIVLTPDSGAPTVFTAQIDNRPVGDVLPVNGGVRPITSTVVSVPVVFPVNTLVTIHCWNTGNNLVQP